jgi:hypothetical protein
VIEEERILAHLNRARSGDEIESGAAFRGSGKGYVKVDGGWQHLIRSRLDRWLLDIAAKLSPCLPISLHANAAAKLLFRFAHPDITTDAALGTVLSRPLTGIVFVIGKYCRKLQGAMC